MSMVTIDQLKGKSYCGNDPVVSKMYRLNEENLNEVLKSVRNGSLVPFFGAGYSADAYPLWGILLRGLAQKCSPHLSKQVDILCDNGNYEDASSLIEKEMGTQRFRSAIARTYGSNTPGEAYFELTPERRAIPTIFKGCVLTSNYDNLIESVFEYSNKPFDVIIKPDIMDHFPEVYSYRELPARALIKIHGDAQNPNQVIITREDYVKNYSSPHHGISFMNYIRTFFSTNSILFLGCSLPNNRITSLLKGPYQFVKHYALVQLPASTHNPADPFAPRLIGQDWLETTEYHEMRLSLCERNIQPIWYPYGLNCALDTLLGWLEEKAGSQFNSVDYILPPIPRSTYNIIGRDSEINNVILSLSDLNSIVNVTGHGGTGKTEVCRAVLRRLRGDGRDVVYLDAFRNTTVLDQCREVLSALGIGFTNAYYDHESENCYFKLIKLLDSLYKPVVYLDDYQDTSADGEATNILDVLYGHASVLISSREEIHCQENNPVYIEIGKLNEQYVQDLFYHVITNKLGRHSERPSAKSIDHFIDHFEGSPLNTILVAEFASKISLWTLTPNSPTACVVFGILVLSKNGQKQSDLEGLSGTLYVSANDLKKALNTLSACKLTTFSNGIVAVPESLRELFFQFASSELMEYCSSIIVNKLEQIFNADDNGHGSFKLGDIHELALSSIEQSLYLLDTLIDYDNLDSDVQRLFRLLSKYFQFNRSSSITVLDKLLSASIKKGDANYPAFVAQELADCYISIGGNDDLENAKRLLTAAKTFHNSKDDILEIANDLFLLSKCVMRQGKLDEARDLLDTTLKLYDAANSDIGLANTEYLQAELSLQRSEPEEATQYLNRALEQHMRISDYSGLSSDFQLQAKIALCYGATEIVIQALSQANRYQIDLGDADGLANNYLLKSMLQYYFQKETGMAIASLSQAEELYRQTNNEFGLSNVNYLKGEYSGDLSGFKVYSGLKQV